MERAKALVEVGVDVLVVGIFELFKTADEHFFENTHFLFLLLRVSMHQTRFFFLEFI